MLAVKPHKHFLKIILIVVLACALIVVWRISAYFKAPLAVPEAGYVLEVAPGVSSAKIVYGLASDGVVRWPSLFIAYLSWSGGDRKIKAGEYFLEPGTSVDDLLQKFYRGDVILHEVTLVEGWTLRQSLQHLCAQQALRCTLQASVESILPLIENPSGSANPEGLLFPDTYRYPRGASDADIVKQANQRLMQILQQAWNERANGLPLQNAYQALVLASIIEKETSVDSEREQVAGVFLRRLQSNMRLQTDPTVIYGLGAEYAGNITREHLQRLTPYNTYRIDGLPPTPIALAGAASIRAAVHPDNSDTVYFVAKGDGSHVFASTLEQHNKNVVQYQLRPSSRVKKGASRK